MYQVHRSSLLKNTALLPRAIGWAMEMTAYANKTYPGFNVKVGVEMFGQSRLHWSFTSESLETFETANAKLLQDQKYWAFIESGKDFWVEGSFRENIVKLFD